MNKGRKYLFLTHIFPPAIDGGSQIIYKLLTTIKHNQNPVIKVVTSDAYSTDDFVTRKKKRIQQRKKSKISRIKTLRWPKSIIRRITGPVFIGFPWLKLIKWKPDIIIGGAYPTTMPIYAWLLAKLTGAELRIVPCTHHRFDNFERFPLIFILKQADLIYCLSNYEKKEFVKRYKISGNKIKVFKPPVDNRLLIGKSDKPGFPKQPTLLFLGNHAAHKRIGMLIKAFQKLQCSNVQIFKKIKLIIAGKRTLHTPEIEKQISKLSAGIRKNIDLQGEFDRKKQIELIDKATVLVNPSEFETLGLVFMETWARKKPVIAADLITLKEIIDDGKDGLLFDQSSINDLTAKIKKLINNPQLAKKMGEKGYQKVIRNYKL
jgi:glycosyltransferase involved in cell wall biosynthesis